MKRFRIQLVWAVIVLICGVSLMGLVYILFNKPEVYISPGIIDKCMQTAVAVFNNDQITAAVIRVCCGIDTVSLEEIASLKIVQGHLNLIRDVRHFCNHIIVQVNLIPSDIGSIRPVSASFRKVKRTPLKSKMIQDRLFLIRGI